MKLINNGFIINKDKGCNNSEFKTSWNLAVVFNRWRLTTIHFFAPGHLYRFHFTFVVRQVAENFINKENKYRLGLLSYASPI